MANDFAMYENIVPGLMPVDLATTTKASTWVDVKLAHSLAFLVNFGAITSSSANYVTITMEASTTNDSTTAVAVPFTYRQSGVVTANTWGAVTSCTSAGITAIAASALTGTSLWIEADLAAVTNDQPTARWVKLELAGGEATAALADIVVFKHSRYHNLTMYSAT
jgi:hypothetical protein